MACRGEFPPSSSTRLAALLRYNAIDMKDFHRFLKTRGFSAQEKHDFAYLWGKIVEPGHLPRLSGDVRPAERAIIWTETDMDKGLPTARKLWQTGEFAHLIISGGDYDKEKQRGNLPSVDMLRRFVTACRKRGLCPRGVTIENYSKHTGWQRVILASVLKSLPDPTQSEPGFVTIREVILVAPRYLARVSIFFSLDPHYWVDHHLCIAKVGEFFSQDSALSTARAPSIPIPQKLTIDRVMRTCYHAL